MRNRRKHNVGKLCMCTSINGETAAACCWGRRKTDYDNFAKAVPGKLAKVIQITTAKKPVKKEVVKPVIPAITATINYVCGGNIVKMNPVTRFKEVVNPDTDEKEVVRFFSSHKKPQLKKNRRTTIRSLLSA